MTSDQHVSLHKDPLITPLNERDADLSSRGITTEALHGTQDHEVALNTRPNPTNIGTQMNRNPVMDIGGVRGYLAQNRKVILAGAALVTLGITFVRRTRLSSRIRMR